MHISPVLNTANCCTLSYVSISPCSIQRPSPSLPPPPASQGIFMLTLSSWPPMGAMPAPDEEPGWWAYTMLCGSLAIIALGTGALPADALVAHAEAGGNGHMGGSASHGKESGSRLRPGVQARAGRLVAACANAAGHDAFASALCPTAGGIKPNVSSFGADQFNLADPQVGWGKGGVTTPKP